MRLAKRVHYEVKLLSRCALWRPEAHIAGELMREVSERKDAALCA